MTLDAPLIKMASYYPIHIMIGMHVILNPSQQQLFNNIMKHTTNLRHILIGNFISSWPNFIRRLYLPIQGAGSYPHLTTQLKQFDSIAMYNEGASEFIDQGLYYPTATNYGFRITGEWEDHHKVFGVDGPDFQYAGTQTESLPYVYYTPSYGFAQSPYNPYNPYIPGAVIGVDGPFVGAQQYYTIPPYQDPASSPAYVPVAIQPDMIANSLPEPLLNTGESISIRSDGRGLKHNLASASAAFTAIPPKPATNQKNSLIRASEGSRARASVGASKQAMMNGLVPSVSSSTSASSHVIQSRIASGSIQRIDDVTGGKVPSQRNQLKVALPNCNSFPDFGSSAHGRYTADKLRPKVGVGRAQNNLNGTPDLFMLGEQNRGPRTNKSKDQLAVKAYTTKAGVTDAQGNIIIYTDQYNKEDFSVDYVDAKFFVIKSYSEDDVHKSIKYGVWSSTSHGNNKLQTAYENGQKIAVGKPKGCPIFLFFSVNASSQFCGVAEMIGPVDFYKDMDFWQQDKWSGSFPVKWHIIKDVPNTCFRHIILENNENKPVTNSRDTQELVKNKNTPAADKSSSNTDVANSSTRNENIEQAVVEAKDDVMPTLNVGSLAINPKLAESDPLSESCTTVPKSEKVDVFTVGSMPIKVNGFAESSGVLTIGTIPLQPKTLQLDRAGSSAKNQSQNYNSKFYTENSWLLCWSIFGIVVSSPADCCKPECTILDKSNRLWEN
ncbi:hypothetical protein LWI28_025326 [Acer negundo]|uniref:YTH domain-containing family protein n=1 Tax=Acer negundo TaxID=4023 RepID=A0AAD5P469_ACENE|nr:hypothetical protein LWI28_025326 [Acer negundo]